MRTLTSLVLALVCAPALASCSDDTPKAEPVVTAQLPDNLCDAVPSSVVERWRLVEKDHDTNESEDRNEASCSMTGEADGEPVTLGVSLTAFGAADKDAARRLMTADLEPAVRRARGERDRGVRRRGQPLLQRDARSSGRTARSGDGVLAGNPGARRRVGDDAASRSEVDAVGGRRDRRLRHSRQHGPRRDLS